MSPLLGEIRRNPVLWLLAFVPIALAAAALEAEAHTLLFVLSVLAIVPLATLLSHTSRSSTGPARDCRQPCCSWPRSRC